MRAELVLGSRREVATVGLVAGLCGAYASALAIGSDLLATNADQAGDSAAGILLGAVSAVFLLVAVYVAAVVIANAVDTVVAGRLRQIAVLRLLGADAGALRGAVVKGATVVAAIGAVVGVLAGTLVGVVAREVLIGRGVLSDGPYTWFPPAAVPAAVVVVAAAAVASWVGSRVVLRATPAQALLGASAPQPEPVRVGRVRAAATVLLLGGGGLVLAAGAALGEEGGAGGFLLAALGAMVSGTGVLVGARLVVPALVAVTCRLLGRDPASRLAARNALREPGRTTRSTMGLVIGVTLVTTFAAGFAALRTAVHTWDLDPAQAAQADEMLRVVSVVMICIVVVSSVIAAVGFVSTMSLAVLQRTREIGLLRALGFTAGQVRTMVVKESVALSATAVLTGMVIGMVYGSLGAQALIGFGTDGFVWGVPGGVLAGIAASGVLLVAAASWAPSSRAVAVAPVEALRAV
jgi:putative ABC transport system permease protein